MSNDSNAADAANIEGAAVLMAGAAEASAPAETENRPTGDEAAAPADGEKTSPPENKASRRRRIVRKILKWVGIVFAALFVLLFLAILFRDPILKAVLPKYLSSLTGVKVEVANIETSLFKGTLRVRGVKVANPEGFTPDKSAGELEELYIKLKLGTIFTKKVEIENINIKGLVVNIESYDAGLKRSNWNAINENIKRKSKPKEKKKEKEEKSKTQVVVRLLKIEQSSVSLKLLTDKDSFMNKSLAIKGMPTVTIPISIEKRNLGEEEKKGGTSWKAFKQEYKQKLTSAGEDLKKKFTKTGKKLKKIIGF